MSFVRTRLVGPLLGVSLVLLVAMASPAASLTATSDPLSVIEVDASGDDLVVDLRYTGDAEPGEATFEIDGEAVDAQESDLSSEGGTSVAVVFDTSEGVPNGSVQLAKDAIAQFAPGRNGIESLSVVTTGKASREAARLKNNIDPVLDSLDRVVPSGQNDLWGATDDALKILNSTSGRSRALVMFVGSQNDSTSPTFTEISTLATETGASLFLIQLEGATVDTAALNALFTQLGGSKAVASDEEFEEAAQGFVTQIGSQLRYTLPGLGDYEGELAALTVSIGDESTKASFRPGIVSSTAETLTYIIPPEELSGLLDGNGKYVIVLITAVAIGGAVLALGLLATKDQTGLDQALRHYEDSYGSPVIDSEEEDGMATNAMLQRAVQVTGDLAEKRGLLTRVETLLERANLPLRAPEALFFYVAFVLVASVLMLFMTRNIFVVAGVGILTVIAPTFIVDFMAKRRLKQFNQILPDMLQLLAGTLRAGYSIGQGVEAVADEIDGPMGDELGRAVTEARLGKPLEDALMSVSQRVGSEDFEWVVMAIGIQREVGGNLAELLMTVSETMTHRERLRRDVAGLTAEGRMSAGVLMVLPPGLGVAMYVINRPYISQLFSGPGLYLMGLAIILMTIGFFWMKKTITIEV